MNRTHKDLILRLAAVRAAPAGVTFLRWFDSHGVDTGASDTIRAVTDFANSMMSAVL